MFRKNRGRPRGPSPLFVSECLQIDAVTELAKSGGERVGDQAVNIAERVMDMVELPAVELPVDIPRMAAAVSAMVRPAAAAAPVRAFGTVRVRRSIAAAARLQIETATVVTTAGLGTMSCSPLADGSRRRVTYAPGLPAALCAVTSATRPRQRQRPGRLSRRRW